ncbi:MAG TPA: hypothetical protein VG325_05310 [Solirubrobacteraceae bacterium]|nr:hypothetical protein [Solirubrobacteraceae bacterium]
MAVEPVAPGVAAAICNGRRLDRLPVSGGQFFQWRFLKRGMWWQAHPYSVSAMPAPRYLRFAIKDLGGHMLTRARYPGRAPAPRRAADAPRRPGARGARLHALAGPRERVRPVLVVLPGGRQASMSALPFADQVMRAPHGGRPRRPAPIHAERDGRGCRRRAGADPRRGVMEVGAGGGPAIVRLPTRGTRRHPRGRSGRRGRADEIDFKLERLAEPMLHETRLRTLVR